jgi:hypothetical protein
MVSDLRQMVVSMGVAYWHDGLRLWHGLPFGAPLQRTPFRLFQLVIVA